MRKKHILHTIILTTAIFISALGQSNLDLVPFATGFEQPSDITHAGDDRIFVVEQAGKIFIVDSEGNVNPTPFLDITDRVKSGGEQGLLGLAFHPDYAGNGYFYVNYTDDSNATNIARFSVSATDPDQADVSSEKTLLTVDQPYLNHNGGDLAFGPNGYLYIGLGDGGSAGDPGNRAQNMQTFLGKMLRIDVDNGDPYGIPDSNPFVNEPGILDEIWASGLRNPWRFSFDRVTGDLWIGDVGQNAIEEIDMQPASSNGGENWGWRCYEGSNEYNTNGCGPSSEYVFPVFEYSHEIGCSVTGGFVYRGSEIPELQGHYFFADYCSDYIWTLREEGGAWISDIAGQFPGNNFSTFGEDTAGELYVAGHGTGTIYKIKDVASGIGDRIDSQKLVVYPNPARDQIQIKTTAVIKLPAFITISDLQGRVVYEMEVSDKNSNLDISYLEPGVFILTFKNAYGQSNKKLIKR
jgi:glucose/arabinose dehydrogenase